MVLETERLVLRPFLESDAADVFEYLTEPMANCFSCMKLDLLEEAKAEMKNRMGETEWYFSKVYPMLLAKAERKGRTKEEMDEIAKGKKME